MNLEPLLNGMTPSVGRYFRSFYYPDTLIKAVDLQSTLPHEPSCPEEVREVAQRLMSSPKVKAVFSNQLQYDVNLILENNRTVERHGFQVIGSKPVGLGLVPFYSVCEHPTLQGWVFKAAGFRAPTDRFMPGLVDDQNEVSQFTSYESLLRLSMNRRIRDAVERLGFGDTFAVPEEYAVPYSDADVENEDPSKAYFILSQKLDILSVAETVRRIGEKSDGEQVALADKVCALIEATGVSDNSFDNIRLTGEGKLALIDTEPAGLLVAKEDPLFNKGHSVEKCKRIGLFTLREVAKQRGLNHFADAVDRHYRKALSEVSITKIVLSLLCPLIPIVILIVSIYKTRVIRRSARDILNQQVPVMFADQVKQAQKDLCPLQRKYYSLIEGAPFPSAQVA